MNNKILPLKFAGLAVLVAFCLLGLWTRGLREGIDLRGGHSLVFEIRTNDAEVRRLEADRDRLEQQKKEAKTDEQIKDIEDAIERIQIGIVRLRDEEEGTDLANRMITHLKGRVDPRGLLVLEWRPQGSRRIEVRMPAARESSRVAGAAYYAAIEELKGGNLKRADIRRVTRLAGDARRAEIKRISQGDTQRARRLAALAETYDVVAATEKKVEAATTDQDKTLAESAYEDALILYEGKEKELLDLNVKLQELQTVLGHHDSPREEAALMERGREGRDEAAERKERYETGLRDLEGGHPARAAQIRAVAESFEKWAKVRQQLDDPADLKRLIAKAGVLEFRVAPFAPEQGGEFALDRARRDRYVADIEREGPEGLRKRNEPFLWFPVRGDRKGYGELVTADYGGQRYLLLYNQPGNMMLHKRGSGGWALDRARSTVDDNNRPAVGFWFNEEGARLFSQMTGDHIGHVMAILLDDEVYSAPVIRSIISSRGVIEGRFTSEEVDELVQTLEAGSLPARLNPVPVSESKFAPSIGERNRELGKQAAYLGLIGVAAFMLIYYQLPGLIANIALVLNMVLVLGTMSWMGAVFTLPGIAGIVLTIGIAVDANVLIFERLREEQAKNQSVRMAIKNAYERAFTAIFDANITTLIVCLILGWVGTEEVRGFAITLSLGVAFSLFTALVVTRWIFNAMLDMSLLKKRIFMLRILGVPRVAWMSKRYLFWGISAAMIAMGVLSLVWQKADIWGIEFSAGTQAVVRFNDDALMDGGLIDDGLVRERFSAKARELGHEKLQATARVETRLADEKTGEFLKAYDADGDGKVAEQEWTAARRNAAFFALIDANGDRTLDGDEIEQNLPESSYQISTTETRVHVIRRVVAEAFGKALRIRSRCTFDPATAGRDEQLGVPLAGNGITRVTPSLLRRTRTAFRDEMRDFTGGVMFVIRDITPPITQADLVRRVREMRLQPDFFAGQLMNETRAIGLTPAGEEGYSSFLVLVRSADEAVLDNPPAWDEFAQQELTLLTEALGREEAMVATNYDAAIAGETAQLAMVAVVLSWLAIVGYVWFRFGSIQWGLAAVICLVHDVIIVVGLVAASKWLSTTAVGAALGIASFKIDLAMVAAILTVIGYSVNDTIVVFDRIRENRGKLSTVSVSVINTSINQTLSRTLLTSGTTFIVVMVMYVRGGSGIHAFNYALLAGILFGTYSSVAIASPLLMGFRKALVARVVGPVADQ